jgi:hypothetical protein
MRIISNFKDYYDGVQAMGHDETLVYRRIQESFSLNLTDLKADRQKQTLVRGLRAEAPKFRMAYWQRILVGVCGKIYLAACYQEQYLDGYRLPKTRFTYYYNTDSLRKAFPEAGYDHDWHGKKIPGTYDPKRYPELGLLMEDDTPFLELKAPIFVANSVRLTYGHNGHFTHDDDTLLVNPQLKQFEFYRLLSDYEVFQELEMYLGNILVGPTMEAQPLADIEKVRSHGFDEKMSFRKRKK